MLSTNCNINLTLRGNKMTIYQVISKENQLEYAYLDYEVMIEEIAKLGQNGDDNYFSINAIEDEDL
jgi:hypothetical protein